ncbi:tyrosine-type recombinase/integrase [Bacillus sp. ISL-7]|uniref:tyrosine-type recombinase/integrase n=1 Tax=Bacillus sp. ISL-7 TaxID=2819136 RepID=UPI001BEC4357|nr:tyrosine-type recombinase/integrase [Bacillus sp. ISL-7]MBT2736610.1 tyrosine-type recombinase/integrase [Bacillus sp. ISL-7]
MNKVEPIREAKDIEVMKKALAGRNKLMFIMGVSFGLRISDLLELKIGDLRGKDFFIIGEEKTKKKGKITLSDTVKEEIAKLDGADTDYVFQSRQGGNKPISRVQAYRILNGAAKKAGILDKIGSIGCHSLRKTFGYQLHKKGVDITRIMAIFGHSSPEITLAYIDITDEEISDAYLMIEV